MNKQDRFKRFAYTALLLTFLLASLMLSAGCTPADEVAMGVAKEVPVEVTRVITEEVIVE